MEAIIIEGNKNDLKLFVDLAKRIGVKTKTLSDKDVLDAGLLNAMKEAKKSKIVPKSQIMKSLKRNASKD